MFGRLLRWYTRLYIHFRGLTKLSQRALPIFGWAAITLGIGPYSSSFFITLFVWFLAAD